MQAAIPFPDISPEIFTIAAFGIEFALRWYALAYIAGIIIGVYLVIRATKRPELWPNNTPPLTRDQIEDFLVWAVLGVILGGRLGYVIFYKPGDYLENPLEVIMIWQGGMAFHGGFLGVIFAAYLYCRKYGIPKMSMADCLALATPAGLFLGRIANFINAELWGRPTDLPWGVIFPGQAAQNCPQIIGLCARHPSQLYEAILEGLILGLLLVYLVWKKNALKTPGFIAGLFLLGYGLGRFVVEFVRQPDAQFISPGNQLGLAWHIQGYGLTMGQILSIPMIIAGILFIQYARRTRLA
ncbi:prolipoprotein diacylglyceryl transferase [Parasulfitobacter algicola]|uniref:Phosphatidylglycerol--prolipoprotein diacylglyceryl transferase n=1 Tax=Parasulfitobacter algicola TaxID=2614809 RepID=A0ABX2IXZ0_9RHOB|nr:prolipoprotein diacylglyceryl transferase [Sulfitobacter algicola]NSX56125.1 prolipoprotein diacylglyceryl transferase [Sulfitobacter algicola]